MKLSVLTSCALFATLTFASSASALPLTLGAFKASAYVNDGSAGPNAGASSTSLLAADTILATKGGSSSTTAYTFLSDASGLDIAFTSSVATAATAGNQFQLSFTLTESFAYAFSGSFSGTLLGRSAGSTTSASLVDVGADLFVYTEIDNLYTPSFTASLNGAGNPTGNNYGPLSGVIGPGSYTVLFSESVYGGANASGTLNFSLKQTAATSVPDHGATALLAGLGLMGTFAAYRRNRRS